jgi:hypothetical protein
VVAAGLVAHLRREWSRVLRLTDTELDIVFAAAEPLAVQNRDAFLQDVAKHLATLPVRGDGIVHRVCAEVQRRHFDAPVAMTFIERD